MKPGCLVIPDSKTFPAQSSEAELEKCQRERERVDTRGTDMCKKNVCTYACTLARMHVCMYVCIACVYIYTYVYIDVCFHVLS